MKKLVLIAVLMSACYRQVRVQMVETPDPEVGDMRCAPAMHISALLDTLHAPPAASTCDL